MSPSKHTTHTARYITFTLTHFKSRLCSHTSDVTRVTRVTPEKKGDGGVYTLLSESSNSKETLNEVGGKKEIKSNIVALATSRTTWKWFHPKNAFIITTKPNQENHTHFELLKTAFSIKLHLILWSSKKVSYLKKAQNDLRLNQNWKTNTDLLCLTTQRTSFMCCLLINNL